MLITSTFKKRNFFLNVKGIGGKGSVCGIILMYVLLDLLQITQAHD